MSGKFAAKAEAGRPSSSKLQHAQQLEPPKQDEIYDDEEIEDDEEATPHCGRKRPEPPEQGPPSRRRFERDEQSPTSSPSGSHREHSPPHHHYDSPSSSRSNSSSYTPPGPGYARGGYGMPHYDRAGGPRPDMPPVMNPRLGPHPRGPPPPHDLNPPPTWRSAAPSSPLLRKGKWTAEEEAYVERIILDFSRGYLALPSGTTLRGYLSEKLNCDPMRITKKYAGASSIGKKTFQPCEKTPENLKALERAQMELAELERRFLESESLRAGRRAAATQIVEALNHRHAAEAYHRGAPPPRHYKSHSYRPGPPPMAHYAPPRYAHGGGGYTVPERMRYYDQMVEEQWESRMREVETSDEETDSDHSGGKGRSMRRDMGGYGCERGRGDPYGRGGGYMGGHHPRRGGPSGSGMGGGGYAEEYRRREEEYNRQGPPPDDYAQPPASEDYPVPCRRPPPRDGPHAAPYQQQQPATSGRTKGASTQQSDHMDGASSSSARSSEASHGQAVAEAPDSDRGDGELLLTFLMSVRKQHGGKDREGEGSSNASPSRPGGSNRRSRDEIDAHYEDEGKEKEGSGERGRSHSQSPAPKKVKKEV